MDRLNTGFAPVEQAESGSPCQEATEKTAAVVSC